MTDEPITDADLNAFLSGEIPTSQAVGDQLSRAAWNLDDGPGDRAFDWLTARADQAMDWLKSRADLQDRYDIEDIEAFRQMLMVDADTVAIWMHHTGAHAGARDAVAQLSRHRAAGRHNAEPVLLPERPDPPLDHYPASDPRGNGGPR